MVNHKMWKKKCLYYLNHQTKFSKKFLKDCSYNKINSSILIWIITAIRIKTTQIFILMDIIQIQIIMWIQKIITEKTFKILLVFMPNLYCNNNNYNKNNNHKINNKKLPNNSLKMLITQLNHRRDLDKLNN